MSLLKFLWKIVITKDFTESNDKTGIEKFYLVKKKEKVQINLKVNFF